MTGQKRMTTIIPFELQTEKRAKYAKDMDFQDQEGVPEEYIPLWKQVQMSFQLRSEFTEFNNILLQNSGPTETRKPTKPMSPKF